MMNLKSTVNTKGACELLRFFSGSTCTYVDASRYFKATLKSYCLMLSYNFFSDKTSIVFLPTMISNRRSKTENKNPSLFKDIC